MVHRHFLYHYVSSPFPPTQTLKLNITHIILIYRNSNIQHCLLFRILQPLLIQPGHFRIHTPPQPLPYLVIRVKFNSSSRSHTNTTNHHILSIRNIHLNSTPPVPGLINFLLQHPPGISITNSSQIRNNFLTPLLPLRLPPREPLRGSNR